MENQEAYERGKHRVAAKLGLCVHLSIYIEVRPHSALDNLPPLACLARLTGLSEPHLTNEMRI